MLAGLQTFFRVLTLRTGRAERAPVQGERSALPLCLKQHGCRALFFLVYLVSTLLFVLPFLLVLTVPFNSGGRRVGPDAGESTAFGKNRLLLASRWLRSSLPASCWRLQWLCLRFSSLIEGETTLPAPLIGLTFGCSYRWGSPFSLLLLV